MKELVREDDAQGRVAHARSSGGQDDPLTDSPTVVEVDAVRNGNGGDIRPLPVGIKLRLGSELSRRTGRHDDDLGRPVSGPEGVYRVDGVSDVPIDTSQQGFGAGVAEVDQSYVVAVMATGKEKQCSRQLGDEQQGHKARTESPSRNRLSSVQRRVRYRRTCTQYRRTRTQYRRTL